MWRWFVALLLLLMAIPALAQGSAADLLKAIADYRADLYTKAQEKADSKPIDLIAIQQQVQAKAEDATKGVDPTKIDPKESIEWAQLFAYAAKPKETASILTVFIATKPDPVKLYQAQQMLLSASSELKDDKGVIATLTAMKPYDLESELDYASLVVSLASKESADMGVDGAIGFIDKALAAIDKGATAGPLHAQYLSLQSEATFSEIEILEAAGQNDKALKVVDEALKSAPDEAKPRLALERNLLALVGNPAPPLKIDRGTTKFPALEDLKGKVVLLEFFGHWCAPCKDAIPDVRKLLADLQPKGLEVVGVTRYYGYFADPNKVLTPNLEFAAVSDFLKEQSVGWPIGFGPADNFQSYGVSAVPQFVVIGRTGIVHDVTTGYSPESFADLRKKIEALLQERG